MDLHKLNFPIRLYFSPIGVYPQFVLETYRCSDSHVQIAVEPGDYVIDAGACWGDTVLYFSHRAGKTGRILSYEFVQENLEIMRRNFALNPALSRNIQIIEKAVWSESNIPLAFKVNGPAGYINKNETEETVTHVLTQTIDNLVGQMDHLCKRYKRIFSHALFIYSHRI